MNDGSRSVQAVNRLKIAIVRRLPPRARVAARDAYHRTRLRAGRNPLAIPEQHQRFLEQLIHELVEARPQGPLVYAEFGVYQGASMAAAVRAFETTGLADRTHFVGFDSFEGLPPGSEDEGWGTGWFVSSRRTTEWNLRRLGVSRRVELVEGWFEQSCTPALAERLGRVDVVMFDCDIFSATDTAIRFVEPLLNDPCILIFDDWFAFNPDESPDIGQVRAFSELVGRHPDLDFERVGSVGRFGIGFVVRRAAADQHA